MSGRTALAALWLAAALGLAGGDGASAQSDFSLGTPVPEEGDPFVGGGAEDTPPTTVRSPVLTVDPDALFEQSLFGQRVLDEVRTRTDELAAENRQIEADLTAEEQGLTDRRPDMAVEDFRTEAETFDDRVQAIRREQDAKERALEEIESAGRERFLIAVQPILGRLMLQRGAVVMLDRRSVFLGFGAIDVTEAALSAIDSELGDGGPPREGPDP